MLQKVKSQGRTVRCSNVGAGISKADTAAWWLLRFFECLGEGGHDFEDVADDAVVGDFEDWGVLVFVDGDDGARAFHAYDVLDGAADAEREVELGRDGLAGAADLALHGEPAFVADRARGGDFAAESFGERFGLGIFSGALMPRPMETMIGACVRSTADLASLKSSSGLVRICSGFRSTLTGFTGALPLACCVDEIGAKCAGLK